MKKQEKQRNIIEFVHSLGHCLIPNGIIGFEVQAKNSNNRFKLCVLVPKANALSSSNSEKCGDIFGITFDRYAETISINGLNALIAAKSPLMMLRRNSFLSFDDLVEIVGIDAYVVANQIVKNINNAIRNATKYTSHFLMALVISSPMATQRYNTSTFSTPEFSTFEEFACWVDLNIK